MRELDDGVVRLRALKDADIDDLVQICQDPEVVRFTTVPKPYRRSHAEARVREAARLWDEPMGIRHWAIETGDLRLAGLIDLRPDGFPTSASLGFLLGAAARGRGIMARAVRLVAGHAFDEKPWGAPVGQLHWTAVAGNWASRRVAWACGFTFGSAIPGSHVDPLDRTAPPLDRWQASLAPGAPLTPRTPWFRPPVISDGSVRLREWRDEDVEAVEPRNDPAHWMPGAAVLSRDTFPSWLMARRVRMADGQAIEWCVADADNDRAYGSVLLFSRGGPLTGDVAELGYQLFPSARGRGVGKRAAALAVRHAFAATNEGGLGLRRLVGETAADNVASNRVLESCGFTVFGRERATDLLPDGRYEDALHWELLEPPRAKQ